MNLVMEFQEEYDSDSSSSSSSSSESEKMLNEADLLQYCKNVVFVDLRGFRANFGRFICKEFCLVDAGGKSYHNFIKSSFPLNRLKHIHQVKVEYEQKVGHRIPYDYGNINIIELITDTYQTLGSAKTIMLRDIFDVRNFKYVFRNCDQFDNCITLKDLDLDQATISQNLELMPYCDFHNEMYGWSSGPCAKNIAFKLRYAFAESEKAKKTMPID